MKRVLATIRRRERQTDTRPWSEDKNSPGLGQKNTLGRRNPYEAPQQRGPLTDGPATETLSCLSFEACLGKRGLAPRRPVDQGGLDRSTRRD